MVTLPLLTLMDISHSVSRLRKLLYHLQSIVSHHLPYGFTLNVCWCLFYCAKYSHTHGHTRLLKINQWDYVWKSKVNSLGIAIHLAWHTSHVAWVICLFNGSCYLNMSVGTITLGALFTVLRDEWFEWVGLMLLSHHGLFYTCMEHGCCLVIFHKHKHHCVFILPASLRYLCTIFVGMLRQSFQQCQTLIWVKVDQVKEWQFDKLRGLGLLFVTTVLSGLRGLKGWSTMPAFAVATPTWHKAMALGQHKDVGYCSTTRPW